MTETQETEKMTVDEIPEIRSKPIPGYKQIVWGRPGNIVRYLDKIGADWEFLSKLPLSKINIPESRKNQARLRSKPYDPERAAAIAQTSKAQIFETTMAFGYWLPDGSFCLCDSNHRVGAYIIRGDKHIPVIVLKAFSEEIRTAATMYPNSVEGVGDSPEEQRRKQVIIVLAARGKRSPRSIWMHECEGKGSYGLLLAAVQSEWCRALISTPDTSTHVRNAKDLSEGQRVELWRLRNLHKILVHVGSKFAANPTMLQTDANKIVSRILAAPVKTDVGYLQAAETAVLDVMSHRSANKAASKISHKVTAARRSLNALERVFADVVQKSGEPALARSTYQTVKDRAELMKYIRGISDTLPLFEEAFK